MRFKGFAVTGEGGRGSHKFTIIVFEGFYSSKNCGLCC